MSQEDKLYMCDSVGKGDCKDCHHAEPHKHLGEPREPYSCTYCDRKAVGCVEVAVTRKQPSKESDPNGIDQHAPGAKMDHGKPRVAMWMRTVPRAILEVAKCATFGAKKYTPYGCLSVENGEERYADAEMRHFLHDAIKRDSIDHETEVLHLAAEAWNSMMKLEFALRRLEDE